jgi:hypothetical protein
VNLYKALSVDRPVLNPNCFSVRILLEFKKLITLLYIHFSNILENDVSNEIVLQLEIQDFLPFLCRGLNFEYSSHSGEVLDYRKNLKEH